MKSTALIFLLFSLIANAVAQSYNESIKTYREKFKQELLSDDRTPVAKGDIQYIKFYEVDESYNVSATFKKTENAIPFDMATLDGKSRKYIEYGTLSFLLHGKKYFLKIYQNHAFVNNPEMMYHLFLPFTDVTNGKETYMGGRYLDFNTGDIQKNILKLDFNKAYNPYCAYSNDFSCPKPPEENNLKVAIKAGEKQFQKVHH